MSVSQDKTKYFDETRRKHIAAVTWGPFHLVSYNCISVFAWGSSVILPALLQ